MLSPSKLLWRLIFLNNHNKGTVNVSHGPMKTGNKNLAVYRAASEGCEEGASL
jgi:hypothetical protein